MEEIRKAVAEEHEVQVEVIVMIRQGTINKTSSGKIQRRACKAAMMTKELEGDEVARWAVSRRPSKEEGKEEEKKGEGKGKKEEEEKEEEKEKEKKRRRGGLSGRAKEISEKIVAIITKSRAMGQAEGQSEGIGIEMDEPFMNIGMSSADMVGLTGELEEWLGGKTKTKKRLGATLLFEFPTIEMLSRHLAGEEEGIPREIIAGGGGGRREEGNTKARGMAIVGIGLRFPGGAESPRKFWEFLAGGRDGMVEIPKSRFDVEEVFDERGGVAGKTNVRFAGLVEGIEMFDAEFFGIAAAEAEAMDPQQRMLLMCAEEALEVAGETRATISGTRTAAVIGISNVDYDRINATREAEMEGIRSVFTATGKSAAIASNRISFHFDLRGFFFLFLSLSLPSTFHFQSPPPKTQQNKTKTLLWGGKNKQTKKHDSK